MTLYFITGNKNKFEEVRKIIPEIEQLNIDLTEIQEFDAHKIIREKINEAIKHHKGKFVIEDTSLYLECLKGLPGPLIKWFLQTIGCEGIFEIVKKFDNTNAEARTILGYYDGNKITFFEGSVKGDIVEPKGEGFGWDTIFIPIGGEKRFSEILKEEKNKISMRGIAFRKLKEYLDQKN
jgi:non-canonical purine NTP pyrophosphatase (RdgB/HAM1 family)